jgi:hypothetical protein
MRESTLISFVLLGFLATALLAFAQDAGRQPSQINIDVRDYCDPTSFNAVLGPGTCVRDTSPGAITFPGFSPSSSAMNQSEPGDSFPTKFARTKAPL